jgi:hypothetical protein
MIHNLSPRMRRRRNHLGFRTYRFENDQRSVLSGFGDGDFIRLRDDQGNEWQGSAQRNGDYIRLQFRDQRGRYATGFADTMGVTLKDDLGNVWRGFVQ